MFRVNSKVLLKILVIGIVVLATMFASQGAVTRAAPLADVQKQEGGTPVPSGSFGPSAPSSYTGPLDVLYDQYNNSGTQGISSQNFEPASDSFDTHAADDFTIPPGSNWSIATIEVDGEYSNEVGPADSVNVVFYTDAAGLPGTKVVERLNLAYVAGPQAGDLVINISPAIVLVSGHYWMEVQANQNNTTNGQWYWHDRSLTSGYPAAWENPGGGFGISGCISWGTRSTTCGITASEPDQVFRIDGSIVSCPLPAHWSSGAEFPVPIVRAVGIWYPPNGRFYSLGGRTSDAPGSDLLNPYEYNPATNSWATKMSTFDNNQVNNMAAGLLNVSGNWLIYLVGGSAAGAATTTPEVRVYNPLIDTLTVIASDPWPATVNTLPGGAAVYNNKLYILGGFIVNTSMSNEIWEFDPNAAPGARWALKMATLPVALGYVPAATIGNKIYTAGGSEWDGSTLVDSSASYVYDPVADSVAAIASIPRATGETRALNVDGQLWVLGGGRTAPNPSSQVDIYDPGTNSWSVGLPFATPRRNFPADIDPVTGKIFLVGGYAPSVPTNTMEIYSPAETCSTDTYLPLIFKANP